MANVKAEAEVIPTGLGVQQIDHAAGVGSVGKATLNDATGAAAEDVFQTELNAYQASIKDGTVLTDWFTGKTYTVENGKVKVDVMPGGSVFVTGEKSSSYRSTFKTSKIGKISEDNSVVARDVLSFTINGEGKLNDKKDTLHYSSMTAINDFAVSANL